MTPAIVTTACVAAGLLGGLLFFGSLRWVARSLAGPGAVPWKKVAIVQASRLGGLVALLWICVRLGTGPLLGAAAGMVAARVVLVAATRRAGDAR